MHADHLQCIEQLGQTYDYLPVVSNQQGVCMQAAVQTRAILVYFCKMVSFNWGDMMIMGDI